MLRVLSLGAGVQSTAMALMASEGVIGPMPDCAIFADTQAEPQAVYDNVRWLSSPGVLPFPVYTVTAGNLWKAASTLRRTRDGERTYIPTAIPVFTQEGLRKGRGRRNCTRSFKIEPINRKIRELIGLKRIKKQYGILAEVWIGISTDEADRMKPNQTPWLKSVWPLIDMKLSREDCIAWLNSRGINAPRSACTFCPFRSDDSWLALSNEEFNDAVQKEKIIQKIYDESTELRGIPFFHDSRKPLDTVKFIRGKDGGIQKLNKFRNECEGMCGV